MGEVDRRNYPPENPLMKMSWNYERPFLGTLGALPKFIPSKNRTTHTHTLQSRKKYKSESRNKRQPPPKDLLKESSFSSLLGLEWSSWTSAAPELWHGRCENL